MKKIQVYLLLPVLLLLFFSSAVWADLQTVSGTFDYTAAHTMLDLVNSHREANGLPALAYDYNLEYYATQRAAELSVLNSHLHPDGSATFYYENYSIGWTSAEQAVTSFMNSQSHRSNILYAGFTGMAAAVFSDGSQWYWVQVFSQGTDTGVANGLSGLIQDSRSVDTGHSQIDSSAYDDHLQLEVGNYIIAGGSSNGQLLTASWTSDDPTVASVGPDGKISAHAAGTAVVTADFGGAIKRILVSVVDGGAPVALPVTAQPETTPPVSIAPETAPPQTAPPETTAEVTLPTVLETEEIILQTEAVNTSVLPLEPADEDSSETGTVRAISAVKQKQSRPSSTTTAASSAKKTTKPTSESSVSSRANSANKQPLAALKSMPKAERDPVNLPLLILAGTAFAGTSFILALSVMRDLKHAKARRERSRFSGRHF